MKSKIDPSSITVEFGGEYEPKDEQLLELLKQAYQGELLVRVALVKTEGIKPFSDYKPDISVEFRNYFETQASQGTPPLIYVYPQNGFFIMSDDYRSYFLYKEKNHPKIMCVVLGDSDSEYIVEKSEPFQLPPPKVEVINN